jgi:hypothetical protein
LNCERLSRSDNLSRQFRDMQYCGCLIEAFNRSKRRLPLSLLGKPALALGANSVQGLGQASSATQKRTTKLVK